MPEVRPDRGPVREGERWCRRTDGGVEAIALGVVAKRVLRRIVDVERVARLPALDEFGD